MKKLLLISALVATSMAATANDYFTVKYEGNEIENGATVQGVLHSTEVIPGVLTVYEYSAELNLINKSADATPCMIIVNNADGANSVINGDRTTYGTYTVCFANAGLDGTTGNCLSNADDATLYTGGSVVPGSALDGFLWQTHFQQCSADMKAKLQYDIYPCTGPTADAAIQDMNSLTKIENGKFTVFVEFGGENAVNAIDAENAAPVYYDLQGRTVANPAAGLYIVKRGNKVTKEFIR